MLLFIFFKTWLTLHSVFFLIFSTLLDYSPGKKISLSAINTAHLSTLLYQDKTTGHRNNNLPSYVMEQLYDRPLRGILVFKQLAAHANGCLVILLLVCSSSMRKMTHLVSWRVCSGQFQSWKQPSVSAASPGECKSKSHEATDCNENETDKRKFFVRWG